MEYLHGGDIYTENHIRLDFSVNTNPLGMPGTVRQAVIRSSKSWEQYPDALCRRLRESLSAFYGGNLSPDHFICGNGASDLLFTLIFALRPGRVLLPVPSFAEYEMALRAAGCIIERFYLRERDDFSAEGGEVALFRHILDSSGIDMVIIGNPNNPSGAAYGEGWLRSLSVLCKRKGIYLVIDECFNWFLKNRERYSVISLMKEAPENYGHVIAINAFTKIYAMAGLRFGYMVCTGRETFLKMAGCRQPWSVSAPAEAAALAALKEREWVVRTLEVVENERKYLTENLKSLGFTVYPSMVNFILIKTDGGPDYKEFCIRKGILIRSCENFEGLDARFYRVAVRLRKDNEELIHCLKEGMNDGEGNYGAGHNVKCGKEPDRRRALQDIQAGRIPGGAF